jgi:hypothetical protein
MCLQLFSDVGVEKIGCLDDLPQDLVEDLLYLTVAKGKLNLQNAQLFKICHHASVSNWCGLLVVVHAHTPACAG